MNITDLTRVIEQVGRDRGIKKELIIEALEQAVILAAQKKFGVGVQLEAKYSEETGEIDLYQFKLVVENEDEIGDPDMDIALEDAQKFDPDVAIGDELGMKLDDMDFGRIDAQTAKQVIFQKVRDAERDIIFKEFIDRKGEVISGIARRVERGNLVIDLGRTDALLPRREIIPGETFKPGDRVQAYLNDVVMTNRGPQLYLSRTSPKFLMKLFETEVPEIRDGIVEIKTAAREPGARAKVAVVSTDRDVDPVGACVGMKGVRVQAVIHELQGEKIDIIPWNENSALFVKAALAPAEISSIQLDEQNKTMEIMVEDNQLSLAIGKRGQNVRLAASLTGWKLDIISKTKLQKRMGDAIFNLKHIDGVTDTLAQAMYQTGFQNVFQVAEAEIETLNRIPGYEEASDAEGLKAKAKEIVEKGGEALMLSKDGTPLESLQAAKQAFAPRAGMAATAVAVKADKAGATPAAAGNGTDADAGTKNARELAEERLKQELAAVKKDTDKSSTSSDETGK